MNKLITKPILQTDPFDVMVRGCRENDLQSQEQLYRHCYPEMIKICLRYAGDIDGAGIIFNNAMLRVFKYLHTYEEEGKLMGWIKTIVVNCSLDFVKQQNKFRERPTGDMGEYELTIPSAVFDTVSAKEMQQVISQLPKATSTVFNLFVYEGFTHKQIAGALKISEGTSKWHVNEARRLLKERFAHLLTNNQ